MVVAHKRTLSIGGLLALGLAIAGWLLWVAQEPPATRLKVGEGTFSVRVAETAQERQQGLSGTEPLAPNEGMLFVFDTDDYHGIWMKDMNYPIDIIWLDAGRTVISIEENVAPETYPESFIPSAPARYIVELPAGTASDNAIEPGVVAEF